MRILVQHRTRYGYPTPAALGPHVIRLRPATHAKAHIETYALRIEQDCVLRWQQDPHGNRVARATFKAGERVASFDVLVEMAVDIKPVNPFDFFVDDRCQSMPFAYPAELKQELGPFLDGTELSVRGGKKLEAFLDTLPREGKTVPFIIAINEAVQKRIAYVIREETGIWTPEETLEQGRGSCRDSAMLLIAALRSRGLAARFVSGYLIQLTDEGMIPDAPKGVKNDVVDLHAWAEVFLPGAGWVGLDATSGLLTGEGHIPLACTAAPAPASPIEGTSDVAATSIDFSMTVARLGHEPRPTTPYTEEIWEDLLTSGDAIDARLLAAKVTLTTGGEPTFNSREHADAPEWNTDALGGTKWDQGLTLALELRKRLAPGSVMLTRMGKHYPGESLPRWALDLCGRKDGVAIWGEPPTPGELRADVAGAKAFATQLAARLALSEALAPAFEDPWRFLQEEAKLPVDVDPHKANLTDSEERRRLARVLDRGLATEAGFVLPLARRAGTWTTSPWTFRRGALYLVPGDSPIGLRLPISSLGAGAPAPLPIEEPYAPRDPRRAEADDDANETRGQARIGSAAVKASAKPLGVRTALCIEPRDGRLYAFLPPLESAQDFFDLLKEIDAVRQEIGIDISIEGYPPPSGSNLFKMSVTPDPGVLEVNLPPVATVREHARLMDHVFDAALHSGLHSEKYMLDGRQAGSGGGNHITMGGPSTLTSPFVQRPDLLASLITFVQHHPSLSYMFTGLFVGPTSQAPRLDEARNDALYELEIALQRAYATNVENPPWLSDMLFRHLLVDVSGNTHRTELCIDKLFDPQTPHGRQGLVELRAFEMPPHPRMVTAQATLARALVAAFTTEPYRAPLVRWGQALHDRFLLPYWMWRDFEDVLETLAARGISLPADAFRPFVDLRCPLVGTLQAGDVTLEIRNAIEPWNVLGEETSATGTARYVDSSMERIEVRATGLVPERHMVLVNGHELPLRPTAVAGSSVGGVRFRAWAPPHSLHAHLGIHHPVRLDVLDAWARRSLGGCAYHVWHPEGRGYDASPLTRFEASARRAQRFTREGPQPFPIHAVPVRAHGDAPYTIDLRRFPMDRPPPSPDADDAAASSV